MARDLLCPDGKILSPGVLRVNGLILTNTFTPNIARPRRLNSNADLG